MVKMTCWSSNRASERGRKVISVTLSSSETGNSNSNKNRGVQKSNSEPWSSHQGLFKENTHKRRVQCVWLGLLTSQQFGVAVDKLRFSFGDEALTCVMEDLDKHALLSSRTCDPLVRSVLKHQVKLRAILHIFGLRVKDRHHQNIISRRRREPSPLTRMESMPLTCRSWPMLHWDLRTNEVEPSNCFTFVRKTCAGFLLVTETERETVVWNNYKHWW